MNYKLIIEHDPDCENPAEYEHNWRVYSFNSRHTSYRDPNVFFDNGKPKLWLRNKLRVGLAHVLSYCEHGLCQWSIRGTGPQCRWDSVRVAGLAIWEHKPNDIGAQTLEGRAKDCADFLKDYTDWLNGNCYYYRIEDEQGNLIDACGRFIGDSVIEAIREALPKDATPDNTEIARYCNWPTEYNVFGREGAIA
jgi:hypothetical protein